MCYPLICDKDIVCASSPRVFVEGRFNLGTPMILINSEATVKELLVHIINRDETAFDTATCATLFHEYIHLIQSILFYACQLPAIIRHWYIWDLYQTAQKRKEIGQRLLPIEKSISRNEWELRNSACMKRGVRVGTSDGEPYLLTLLDVVEGIARILEEGWLGYTISENQLPYTTIRSVNSILFKKNPLSKYELLDVCEIALRKEFPGEAFVSLCRIIDAEEIPRDEGFYSRVCSVALNYGLVDMDSQAEMIVANTKGMFTSNIFADYVRQIESLYSELPKHFGVRHPIFSSLLKSVETQERRGLPNEMLLLIMQYGSVPFVNSLGIIEQFDRHPQSDITVSAVAINAFVSNLMDHDGKGQCEMSVSCRVGHLPVDDKCCCYPWGKVIPDGLCPYLAVKRAFGLDGLSL